MNNKLGKFIAYCGCAAGALSFLLFVIAPAIIYGIFPQHAEAIEQSAEKFMTAIHADQIIAIVGPILFFGTIIGIPVIAFAPLVIGYIGDRRKKSRLKLVGVRGSAKIISVEDTGITINNSPFAKITVENTQTHTRFSFSTAVSRIDLPTAGDPISIVYDPADPAIALPAFKFDK